VIKEQEPQTYRVRIEADGPRGPLDPLEIEVDLTDWREARDAPDGSLHHVRGAIQNLTKAVDSVAKRLEG
jgi:hypothetical protein